MFDLLVFIVFTLCFQSIILFLDKTYNNQIQEGFIKCQPGKTSSEKSDGTKQRKFYAVFVYFICNLVFMCKGSQTRFQIQIQIYNFIYRWYLQIASANKNQQNTITNFINNFIYIKYKNSQHFPVLSVFFSVQGWIHYV